MALELKFNINVRKAAILIENGEVSPFIDYKNTRYIIQIDRILGTVIWTPFNIQSQELEDGKSYRYPYASHNMLFDAILGPRARVSPTDPVIIEWPDFPVPDDNPGSVYP
jgi:hypothetical protein